MPINLTNYKPLSILPVCPSPCLGPIRLVVCPRWRRLVPPSRQIPCSKPMAYGMLAPADGWYLADDSGIEIDALDGRPGVISARYAGEPCDDERNNDKVLQEMQDVPEGQRACRFRCVLALVGQGIEETFSGACEGTVFLHRRKGDGGFGYDPLFLPNESEHTFAEIGLDEKAKISHRARALAKLINWLKNR